jgi:hypothetical protein
MFDKQTIVIDSQEKVGTLPDLTSNWSSRNPLRDGAISVGKYTVPDNNSACIKFLWPFGQFANIPRVPSLASIPVGIVKLQVNGVDKMEFRIGGIKATFGGSLGTADFDIGRRQIEFYDGLQFAESDVIRLIVTQDKLVTTGSPQVCYNASFIGVNTSTGATIIEKQRSIITTETADQVIATYTVLSGGFTLQDITLQTQVGDFMMGHMQILINGMVVMEFPVSDSVGCTRPSGGMFGMIPFYDGLNFGAGNTIEARIDPSVSVNQKFHLFTIGEETATGGSTESKLKRWTGVGWYPVGTIVVFQ